jgi:hypothetical protein
VNEVHVWAAGAPPETPTVIGRQFAAEPPFVGVAGVAFAPDGKGVAALARPLIMGRSDRP